MQKALYTWTVPVLLVLFLLGAGQWWARSAPAPASLGVVADSLADCGDASNCAAAQLTCGDLVGEALLAEVMRVVRGLDRLEVVTQDESYVHAIQRSMFWGFPDDIQLLLRSSSVDIRSQARRGAGDLGVNANRVKGIQDALASRCVA